jgi:hypothetical protein
MLLADVLLVYVFGFNHEVRVRAAAAAAAALIFDGGGHVDVVVFYRILSSFSLVFRCLKLKSS